MFQIKNYRTGAVQFECELSAEIAESRYEVQLGFAAQKAFNTGADLTGAELRCANMTGFVLTGAALTGVPVVPGLDAAILRAIKAGGRFDMHAWHGCQTAHCRGGWAIALAGKAGIKLEVEVGSAVAAALIYAASRPNKPIPDFYATDDDAMADIERCAAEQEASA